MDKKTELLVSLAASTAANCMPCFNYYHRQAEKLALEPAEIIRAVEIANKIKNSISMLMGKHVRETLKLEDQDLFAALEDAGRPCWEKP
jgi:hypothetical protein